jgi:formiminoglutamase
VGSFEASESSDEALEGEHVQLTKDVFSVFAAGGLPFVVGGGNDQSYCNAKALLDHLKGAKQMACVNIDAHFDVRPLKQGKVHSGSPFRLLLEDGRFDGKNFCEFAAQGAQCSAQHADYVEGKGGSIVWLSAIREQGCLTAFNQVLKQFGDDKAIFVSFDLDSVAGDFAPGVSCPGAIGLSSDESLQICFAAGANPATVLFDLSEFNPEIEPYRTGKLVAAMFYHFLLGYKSRQ